MKIIWLCLLLLSCENLLESKRSSETQDTPYVNMPLKTNRLLNETEIPIAKAICSAFEYKRLNFISDFFSTQFLFNIKQTGCTSTYSTSDIIYTQISGNLQFVSNYSGNFFEDIQTDEDGFLQNICTSLDLDKIPYNSEIHGYNQIRQFSFQQIDQNLAKFFVAIGPQKASAAMVYEYIVQIANFNTPSTLGLVHGVMLTEKCPVNSIKSQKYLSSTLAQIKN